jgi:hypothetical protein
MLNKKTIHTIISRYKEDISWLNKAPLQGVIINKGNDVKTQNASFVIEQCKNFGANQYDLCNYIYQNYEQLPELIMFIQGNPFDHCSEHIFYNKVSARQPCFMDDAAVTAAPNSGWRKSLEIDGGFSEKNNNWYIVEVNKLVFEKFNFITCQISSYDEFMNAIFQNYSRLEWLRFAPGSQYIVSSCQCRRYTRNFWKTLRDFIPKVDGMNGGVEAHIIERALGIIFLGIFDENMDANRNEKLIPRRMDFNVKINFPRKALRLLRKIFK